MFLLMLFMFCFFLGFIAMFIYLLGKMESQTKALADEHAQIRVLLRAIESRLEKLSQMEKLNALMRGETEAGQTGTGGSGDEAAGRDPLLHLSFDKPQIPGGHVDPGLSLDLDPVSWDLGNSKDQA